MEFSHKPIMVKQIVEFLQIKPKGIYVDCTVGGGGHSYEIAKKLDGNGMLIGIDRDQEAIKASQLKLAGLGKNIKLVHDNFLNIKKVVENNAGSHVDGILLDLGVSSYQLDNAQRGFSYQKDASLDMRMDKSQPVTAEVILNEYDKSRLTSIISNYGEEKWSKRIADFIDKYRQTKRIETTGELVEIIKQAVPASARREGPHPAKRTFQAIRIEVNHEIEILEGAVRNAVECLKPGGRICVITFHSLEDRIVKQTFVSLTGKCSCPPDFPVCRCDAKADGKIVTRKPVEPIENEIRDNPRARSSKLRVFERI